MKKFSLYDLALSARKVVVVFLILAIVVIAIDTLAKALQRGADLFTPSVTLWQDIPSNGFGKLTFPEIKGLTITPDSRPSFDTRGDFPTFPDTALIYQISKPREKLDSIDKAKTAAERLGFTKDNFTTQDSLMTWQGPRQTRNFSFHPINNTWDLTTVSYFQDANALQPKTTDKETDYGSAVPGMLGQLGLTRNSFSNGKTTFDLVKRKAENFAPVEFNENPEYAIANLYRQLTMSNVKPTAEVFDSKKVKITDFHSFVYTSDPFRGSVHMVLADKAQNPATELYDFKFTDYDYTSNSSYYFVIPASIAWQNVQNGNGVLVSLLPQSKNRFQDYEPVKVKRFTALLENTEIAYFEPNEWTGFVYPIYIFRGNADLDSGETAAFTFYVNALRP